MKHPFQIFFFALLVTTILFPSNSFTLGVSQNGMWNGSISKEQGVVSNHYRRYKQDTPTETVLVNLPIVEQNAQTTPEPVEGASEDVAEVESESVTPTPTPIPIQRGSVNMPIVIGALAIILVVFLAWFFVDFLPSRNRK